MSQFHDMLKVARFRKKWLIKDVAERIGRLPSYYSELENGYRPIPRDHKLIKKLEAVLEIPEGELIQYADLYREIDTNNVIKNILKSDIALASSYCRATESASDNELKEALKIFIKQLSKRGSNE